MNRRVNYDKLRESINLIRHLGNQMFDKDYQPGDFNLGEISLSKAFSEAVDCKCDFIKVNRLDAETLVQLNPYASYPQRYADLKLAIDALTQVFDGFTYTPGESIKDLVDALEQPAENLRQQINKEKAGAMKEADKVHVRTQMDILRGADKTLSAMTDTQYPAVRDDIISAVIGHYSASAHNLLKANALSLREQITQYKQESSHTNNIKQPDLNSNGTIPFN